MSLHKEWNKRTYFTSKHVILMLMIITAIPTLIDNCMSGTSLCSTRITHLIPINPLGSDKLNNLPKVSQLGNDIAGIYTQADLTPEPSSSIGNIKLGLTLYSSVFLCSFHKY